MKKKKLKKKISNEERLRRTIQSQRAIQGYVAIGNIDKNFIRIKNLVVRISAIKSISTFVSTNKNHDFVMTITCFDGKEDIQYSVELGNMEDAELIYCVLMEQIGAKDISENIKWEE